MKNRNIIFGAILSVLACFAFLPQMYAVSPPPDGGYPGANTAEGQGALLSLTTGGYNTAVGFFSLRSDTAGAFNTAIGAGTLLANTADENTATGAGALLSNTTGEQNTADGAFALVNNTNGVANTAIGRFALFGNTTGSLNTTLGASAGNGITTASNVICIGANFFGGNVSNSCFIGHIRGVQTVNNDAVPVLVDSAGQLGTISSSARFKKDIKEMDKASEAILALKPVTFHYKTDNTNRPEFGLIAEEVAKVNPNLVVRDQDGEIYTVRYEAVNMMLLNEFLKEHRKVQKLEKDLRATIEQQQQEIEALTTGLQKVSDQLEISKPAPQIASSQP